MKIFIIIYVISFIILKLFFRSFKIHYGDKINKLNLFNIAANLATIIPIFNTYIGIHILIRLFFNINYLFHIHDWIFIINKYKIENFINNINKVDTYE